MSALTLARAQFALTVMVHYLYPVLTMGLGVVLVIVASLRLRRPDETYQRMARFWTHIFGVVFAGGVATGVVMEFEFGTNWASYSRFVGDIFGAPLAAEGRFPARVIAQHRGRWTLAGEQDEWSAALTGRLRHEAREGELDGRADGEVRVRHPLEAPEGVISDDFAPYERRVYRFAH